MSRIVFPALSWAIGIACTAALALLAWPSAHEDPAARPPASTAAATPTDSSARFDGAPLAGPAAVAPGSAAAVPAPASPAPAARVAVSMSAPPSLQVGEVQELVISVGAVPDGGELGLTLRFDPNVLQVRSAAPGPWAAEVPGAGFEAEVSEAADRVHIRSTLPGRRAGASLAVVQVQGVSPGLTSVAITDVALRDPSGVAMAPMLAAPRVQLAVDSPPPRQ